MYRNYFLNGNEQKYLYKLYANKLTKVKTLAKKNYFSAEFDKTSGNARETWKIINALIHKKDHQILFQIKSL